MEGRLVLQLRRSAPNAATRYLLLSPLPEAQGLGTLEDRPPCPPRPPALAAYLRAHVCGGRVEGARSLPFERVVELRLRGREGAFLLFLEATGRRGNLAVADPSGAVRAAHRWEPAATHPLRPLEPGGPYAPPPAPPGLRRPDEVTREEWEAWRESGEPLHRRVSGLGPALSRELAGISWESYRSLVESWGEGAEARSLDAAGRGLVAVAGEARARADAADAEGAARARRKRLEGRLAKIRADLAALADPEALRSTADALAASLWTVRRGDAEARVPALSVPGETLAVPLDTALTPGENLGRLYEGVRRAQRARAALERRVGETLAEIETVEAGGAAAPAPAEGEEPGRPFRRLKASNGWPLWMGRNGRENDRLVKEARPWDLWFHARDVPGAHVLLRLPGRDAKVPEAVVLEAASLAARHCRASGAGAVDVMVAEAGRVRKPKGASPGRVVVSGERTVRVRTAP